jgi:basic amino acid/polyamine antiporter, APA family
LSNTTSSTSLVRGLGLTAAVSIVIGDVIGTGVFLKARVMTCNVETPLLVLTVWIVAGLLSLAGALTYGELAAMMPRAGGEYVFVREAYGRAWAFLFGWMRFFIGNTGGVAALAAGLAIFLNVLAAGSLTTTLFRLDVAGLDYSLSGVQAVAIGAIATVTLINSAAVTVGGRIASVLASLKVVLILGLGTAALVFAPGDWAQLAHSGAGGACEGVAAAARGGVAGFGAAMMAALWAYNGWNEMTYVSGEIGNPNRNLPLALITGIGVVGMLYVFVNTAYFYVLAPATVASVPLSSSVATETVARFLGPAAVKVMAGALVISIFSALHVASLVHARVPYAMASDGLFFKALGRLSPRTRVPVRALVAQSAWAVVLVLSGSFDALTDYAIFSILLFSALITSSIFVLRMRMPEAERPYRTWGYPVTPALFLLMVGYLLVNAFVTAPVQAFTGLALILAGLPFYWYWAKDERRGPKVEGRLRIRRPEL